MRMSYRLMSSIMPQIHTGLKRLRITASISSLDDISAARNEELKEMNEKGKDEPENGIKM